MRICFRRKSERRCTDGICKFDTDLGNIGSAAWCLDEQNQQPVDRRFYRAEMEGVVHGDRGWKALSCHFNPIDDTEMFVVVEQKSNKETMGCLRGVFKLIKN